MDNHCRVIAPSDLPENTVFETTVSGITFEVPVPKGGVKKGEVFEAPLPTQEYYSPSENDSHSFLHTLFNVSSFFCWCCCCWTIMMNHTPQTVEDESEESDFEQQKDLEMIL